MHLLRDYRELPGNARHAVLAIGNFDGLHRGHAQVLRHLKEKALQYQAPAMVMSFEPLPRQYFRPEKPNLRILPLHEKLRRLRDEFAVDVCLLQRFTAEFANLSATAFMQHVLEEGLSARYVITGEEFRFGKDRVGDVALLQEWSQDKTHLDCEALPLTSDGEKISSTRVREALLRGDMPTVEHLLGYPYYWSRRVVHGNKRGVGAPTANLLPPPTLLPRRGVYAMRIWVDETPYAGVGNFGIQPSFAEQQERLEVHLFEYQGDLYSKRITVEWKAFLRDEQAFATTEALRAQIAKDSAQAKEIVHAK